MGVYDPARLGRNVTRFLAYSPERQNLSYSQFHFTLLRHVAKFVGKLDTRLLSSQLRSELDNQIANFKMNFPTSIRSSLATSSNLPCKVRDIGNKWFED